jgi:predicted TIM-barrel fold metal-dependent hydrolase
VSIETVSFACNKKTPDRAELKRPRDQELSASKRRLTANSIAKIMCAYSTRFFAITGLPPNAALQLGRAISIQAEQKEIT